MAAHKKPQRSGSGQSGGHEGNRQKKESRSPATRNYEQSPSTQSRNRDPKYMGND